MQFAETTRRKKFFRSLISSPSGKDKKLARQEKIEADTGDKQPASSDLKMTLEVIVFLTQKEQDPVKKNYNI